MRYAPGDSTAGVGDQQRPHHRVGAGVAVDVDAQGLDGAVAVAADLDLLELGAGVAEADHVVERFGSHRTGRPTRRASKGSSISSGYGRALAPKLPPTSGAMTRTCVSSP